jgi:hypothetical protein
MDEVPTTVNTGLTVGHDISTQWSILCLCSKDETRSTNNMLCGIIACSELTIMYISRVRVLKVRFDSIWQCIKPRLELPTELLVDSLKRSD